MSLFMVISIGAVAMVIAMAFAWVLTWKTGNGGLVDVVWTFSLGVTAAFYCLAPDGDAAVPLRQAMAAILMIIWMFRLGVPLWRRNVGGPEDVRYTDLRKKWGAQFLPRLFGFLMIQALMALVLALAVMVAGRNPLPFGFWDGLGMVWMLAAMGGGYTSDVQLAHFKADPAHRGKLCDAGLWGRSRHPNYFFEFVFWSGWIFPALAGGRWTGLLALAAPVLIYWLLRYVSGETLVEPHMERRYGQAFRDYCSRVPAFFPHLF